MAAAFLWLVAASYLVFGAAMLAAPQNLLDFLGLTLAGEPTRALNELRGAYGGLNLAIGGVLAHCALRPRWREPGLLLVVILVSGYLSGRLVSFALDGLPDAPLLAVAGIEAALISIALALWVRRPRPAAG